MKKTIGLLVILLGVLIQPIYGDEVDAKVETEVETEAETEEQETEAEVPSEPSGWAARDIEVINQVGVYTDALQGGYQDSITRLEFTELIMLTYKAMIGDVTIESTLENPFTDVDHEDVTLAYEIGIIHGSSATTFSPDAYLNREQMMSIYVRMMRKIEAALEMDVLDYTIRSVDYEDEGEVSQWAFDSMIIASINGLIQGSSNGYLMPKQESTIEQALIINYRIVRKIEETEGYGEEEDLSTTLSGELGMVTADVLNFRSGPNTVSKANIIGKLYQFDIVSLIRKEGDWYYLKDNRGNEGYAHGDFIKQYEVYEETTELRSAIVSTAKEYIGLNYVYGGTSLINGADCSGFIQTIYGIHGVPLRRTGTQQSNQGQVIDSSQLMLGDLITYGYDGVIAHIAVYVGNGQIIHATSGKGVVVTNMVGYLRMPIIGYRRVIME